MKSKGLWGLAKITSKILCLFVGLLCAFFLGISAYPGSECDEWKVDCTLSLFVSSHSDDSLKAIQSIYIVYIYELPEKEQHYYSLCKIFGMDIKKNRQRDNHGIGHRNPT